MPEHGLAEALGRFVERLMTHGAVPGVSVAVSQGGASVLTQGFGLADVSSGRPVTETTLFYGGSMSKLYTAVAVLQMAEAGRVALDQPVNDYLAFRIDNPLGERPITLRDLMTHRSGMTSDTGGCDHYSVELLEAFLREGSEAEVLPEYEGSVRRWSAKVGERWQYSNFGIALLGHVVERVDPRRRSFSEYIHEMILAPLGMKDSSFPASEHAAAAVASSPDFASGYSGYGDLLVATPEIRFASYPAGALLTTPSEHQRLLLALAGAGVWEDVRLLSSDSVAEMLQPAVESGPDLQTGLVAQISRKGTLRESFGHWGAYMWGWWNGSAVYPRLDLAVTVCSNRWDMVRYIDPGALEAPRLIIGFAADWYARKKRGHPPLPERSWAWKTSYVAGLALAERTKGVLGIENALGPEVVQRVVDGTHEQSRWEPSGFAAGVNDMLGVPQNPAAVESFLVSDDVQVLSAELELIHHEMGGRGPFALPPELGSLLVSADSSVPETDIFVTERQSVD